MARLHRPLVSLLVLLAAGDDIWAAEDDTALLQVDLGRTSGQSRSALQQASSQLDLLVEDVNAVIASGVLSQGMAPTATCGRATFQDLSKSLTVWRVEHPHEDGFCYFQNMAWWFEGYSTVTDLRSATRSGAVRLANDLCIKTKANGGAWARGTGPAANISYDGGLARIAHLDTCVDLIDDLYCNSLGWLKGQRLDGRLMDNRTAWEALGRAECERIRQTYNFQDEEVTVGQHIYSTPLEFRGVVCAAKGGCPPVSTRQHFEHVYTKCLLGGGHADVEMAYCYYKGCVMADGRIGHDSDCGYD